MVVVGIEVELFDVCKDWGLVWMCGWKGERGKSSGRLLMLGGGRDKEERRRLEEVQPGRRRGKEVEDGMFGQEWSAVEGKLYIKV